MNEYTEFIFTNTAQTKSDQFNRYNVYYVNRESLEPLLVCQSGWKKHCAPGHSFGPAVRDHYVIHYIIKGKGRYFDGVNWHSVEKGQGFLILPNRSTYYIADEEEPWNYYWVGFNGVDAKKLLKQANLDDEHLIFSNTGDDGLQECMRQLSELNVPDFPQSYAVLGYLYIFFSILYTQCDDGKSRASTDREYVEKAAKYIRNWCMHPQLTVQDIAQHVGLHRSHLYRLFMQVMKMSIQECILRSRVEMAKYFLNNSNSSLSEISFSCGFSTQSHFSTQFKRIVGVSPSRFRRTERT